MDSVPFIDDDILNLQDRVEKLEKEKLKLTRKLEEKEIELLKQDLSNDEESGSDDFSLNVDSDSDSDSEFDALYTEMEVENLRHLFQIVKKDAANQRSTYEDQIKEMDALITDLNTQIKGLMVLKEQEESIKNENETLKSTIQRLVEQHQQEVLLLNQQIKDFKYTSKQIDSLKRSVKVLTKERDALKAKVYSLEKDDGGRKLSGSSESYELIQLRKANEKLLKEISDLHDALSEESSAEGSEVALAECCEIVNDCVSGEWVNLVCPMCHSAIPGDECDLCAAFMRIIKLKEERDRKEKEPEEGELHDEKVPIFMLVVVMVVVTIILFCWFLCFFLCLKNISVA